MFMFCLGAKADPIAICIDNQSHPPYFYLDKDGTMQILLKMSAAKIGLELAFHPVPAKRCLEEVRTGVSDATGAVAITPLSQSVAVFPLRNG